MDDVRGYFLRPPHGTTPAAVTTNRNRKLSSLKSSENIQKKEGGPDSTVSNNQFSSVTLNELAMNARKRAYYNFKFHKSKWCQNSTNLFRIHESKPLIFSDFSEYYRSFQRTKVKYKLHYG